MEEGAGLLELLLMCRCLGQGYVGQGAPMGAKLASSNG